MAIGYLVCLCFAQDLYGPTYYLVHSLCTRLHFLPWYLHLYLCRSHLYGLLDVPSYNEMVYVSEVVNILKLCLTFFVVMFGSKRTGPLFIRLKLSLDGLYWDFHLRYRHSILYNFFGLSWHCVGFLLLLHVGYLQLLFGLWAALLSCSIPFISATV